MGKGHAIFFWILALTTLGGAIFTITRRNAVTATMGLVGTFFALAGLYAMLFAHFLAVIQILIYAGAVMVLFVFVVMTLNKEEEEPWAARGFAVKAIAGLSVGYLIYRFVDVLWGVQHLAPAGKGELETFGTTREMGSLLFSDYLFPFEAVSIVLIIAVVGALVLAHPSREAHGSGGTGEAAPPPEVTLG